MLNNKLNIVWMGLLAWFGVAALIAFFLTPLLMFALIVPPVYVLLTVSPTIFLYLSLLTIFFYIFSPFGFLKWVLSPVLTLIIAYGVPYHYNAKAHEKIDEYFIDDIVVEMPINGGREIALEVDLLTLSSMGVGITRHCGMLCRQLLFQDYFENVVVNERGWDKAFRYFLVNSDSCKSYETINYTNPKRNLWRTNVEELESGECLVGRMEQYDKCEFIYRKGGYKSKPHYFSKSKLNPEEFFLEVNRIQLEELDRANDSYVVLYKKTEASAELLKSPLMVVIGGHLRYAKPEVARYDYEVNSFSEDFRLEEKEIFGEELFSMQKSDSRL